MKFSLKLLTSFSPIIKDFFKSSPDRLIEDQIIKMEQILCKLGFEIESWEKKFFYFKDIVAARVLSVKNDESLKRVRICSVGSEKIFNVLCGAPLIEENKLYAFAKPGSYMGNILIQEKKIGSYISEGMLCSGKELGLLDNNLLELDEEEFQEGEEIFHKTFDDEDILLNIAITTNRPDCLAHIGLAREMHIGLGGKIDFYGNFLKEDGTSYKEKYQYEFFNKKTKQVKKINNKPKIEIESQDILHFSSLVAEGFLNITPIYMQQVLSTVGIFPHSTPVDIANFVTLLTGQPFHIYDKNKMDNNLVAKNLREKTELTILGGKELNTDNVLVLRDKDNNIYSLLGIIGCENSKCTKETKTILIECAIFSKIYITESINKLKISSDAAYRYQREVNRWDSYNAIITLLYFLSAEYQSEIIISENIKTFNGEEGGILEIDTLKKELFLSLGQWYSYTEIGLTIEEQEKILSNAGFFVKMFFENLENSINKNIGIKVSIPQWRYGQFQIPEDLIGEIMRLHKDFKIENKEIKWTQYKTEKNNTKDEKTWKLFSTEEKKYKNFEKKIKKYLSLYSKEIKTMPLNLEKKDIVEFSYVTNNNLILRNSLLDSYKHMEKIITKENSFEFFEIGTVFFNIHKNTPCDFSNLVPVKNIFKHCCQKQNLIFILSGIKNKSYFGNGNNCFLMEDIIDKLNNFLQYLNIEYDIKNCNDLGKINNYTNSNYITQNEFGFIYANNCKFLNDQEKNSENNIIGFIGKMNSSFIQTPTFVFELNLYRVYKILLEKNKDVNIIINNNGYRFTVDISMVISKEIKEKEFLEFSSSINNLIDSKLVSTYPLNQEEKSLTIRFWLEQEKPLNENTKLESINYICNLYKDKFNCVIK